MNINDLIAIVKKKLKNEIIIESIKVEDKSFLHVGHKGNDKKKFHLKISINSKVNTIICVNLNLIIRTLKPLVY